MGHLVNNLIIDRFGLLWWLFYLICFPCWTYWGFFSDYFKGCRLLLPSPPRCPKGRLTESKTAKLPLMSPHPHLYLFLDQWASLNCSPETDCVCSPYEMFLYESARCVQHAILTVQENIPNNFNISINEVEWDFYIVLACIFKHFLLSPWLFSC